MSIALKCFEFNPSGEPLTERHLQALWYDRDMRPPLLRDADGVEIRVADPGEWNLGHGPDFKNATLEVGKERRRVYGDVEIHLRPSDWTSHGHGADSAYGNVVAHVTWTDGPPPPTLPKGTYSIAISKTMADEIGFTPEQIDLTGYPFARLPVEDRPCRRLFDGNPDLARLVLAQAGAKRLIVKSRIFAVELASTANSRKQVMYESLMEALGYRHNSKAFHFIARRIPYESAVSEHETLEQAYLAVANFVEWDMRNVRPNNSPLKRLSAAAKFFSAGHLEELLNASDFSPGGCKKIIGILGKYGFMGHGRASAVLANALVPMAMAEGRISQPPDWLPPEDLSSPMRLTAFRMLGRDHNPSAFYLNNGLRMQGLLQIHREFCLELYPDCKDCAVALFGAA